MKHTWIMGLWLVCCGPTPDTQAPSTEDADDTLDATPARTPVEITVASFNVSMYRSRSGELIEDLEDGALEQARLAAAILQRVRPDVVLLNEFDHDAEGEAASLFHDRFLAIGQDGQEPLSYPYRFTAPVNTGVPSGQDLDNSGSVVTSPGSTAYASDCFGYGTYPGQYGMVIFSRYPIDLDAVRTFQTFLWRDMPDAQIPTDWYDEPARDILRLSSKSHWDLPIDVEGETLHLLASHPTPPSFDGPEDRNGRRNRDEIRFWNDYIAGESYPIDDAGGQGGLEEDAAFVVVGDLNADPHDGETSDAIRALLESEAIQETTPPMSEGGVEQATDQGGANARHAGPPGADTADFADAEVGNLRVDYALPSANLEQTGSGVFWPTMDDPDFSLVGTYPFPVSDHRLVWVRVRL